jgi:hypothetical protein
LHILFHCSPAAEASVEEWAAQEEEGLAAVSLFFVSSVLQSKGYQNAVKVLLKFRTNLSIFKIRLYSKYM